MTLISADRLVEKIRRAEPVVLLDVRWALGHDDGRAQYQAGHIPGAVFVDLETELAAPAAPELGRHPLPSIDDLQAAARRWGISTSSQVVAYDATGNLAAARAWWLLRWGGLTNVALLDGGIEAWTRAGGALASGDELPDAPGNVVLSPGNLPTISPSEAAARPGNGVLLDARAFERYTGQSEPVDVRAGHIPGARSAPTIGNIGPDGYFLSLPELRKRFSALGIGEDTSVGVYCGSGVTAAHQIAALSLIGITAELYPGSWSQWACDSSRPIATAPHREV